LGDGTTGSDRLVVTSQREQRLAQTRLHIDQAIRVHISWSVLEHRAEPGNSVIEMVQRHQRTAKIEARRSMAVIDRQNATEALDRISITPGRRKRVAQVGKGGGIAGPERIGTTQYLLCLIV
jgi:hypothetical protein